MKRGKQEIPAKRFIGVIKIAEALYLEDQVEESSKLNCNVREIADEFNETDHGELAETSPIVVSSVVDRLAFMSLGGEIVDSISLFIFVNSLFGRIKGVVAGGLTTM